MKVIAAFRHTALVMMSTIIMFYLPVSNKKIIYSGEDEKFSNKLFRVCYFCLQDQSGKNCTVFSLTPFSNEFKGDNLR